MQALAHRAYPLNLMGSAEEGGWTVGPIAIDWPNPHSLVTIFSRLSSRTLIADTNRLATFDFLDARHQAVTDFSWGGIIFSEDPEQNGGVVPSIWLPVSFIATNFDKALFYSSNLREANFSYARLSGAKLSRAQLLSANLSYADCRKATLSEAKCDSMDAPFGIFEAAVLDGVNFKDANFVEPFS